MAKYNVNENAALGKSSTLYRKLKLKNPVRLLKTVTQSLRIYHVL